jgi:hypothetical protein
VFLQGNPVLFKAFLHIGKTDERDGLDNAEIVAMVSIMGIVITDDTPVVACVDPMVDVGQVVANDAPGALINSYLPP